MNLHEPIYTSHIKSVSENTDYPKFISPLELLSNITPPGYGEGAPYWWMIPQDRTQAPPQGPLSPLFVESAYRQMLALIRQILDENSVAIGFLDHIRNFVIGEGSKVQFHLPGDDADAADSSHDALRLCHRVWEEWREQNDWGCGTQDREDEAFRRLVRDGEATLRFFRTGRDRGGLPQIRFVEPEQIRTPPGELPEGPWGWGVLLAEDDAEQEGCYWIADLFDANSDGEEVEVDRIIRVKGNVDRCVKRGISDFYPVKDEVTRIHNLLGNMGEVAKSLSTLAYIREHAPTTTASQIQTMISSGIDYQHLPRLSIDGDKTRGIEWYDRAQVLDVSNGQKFVAPPVMTGAQSLLQVEQAMLRAVGLRWGCPEYFSGDASNANFASTLVAGGPFERAARKRQQKWAGFVVAIVRRVFEFAEASGRLPSGLSKHIRIQATLPSVAIANRVDETKRRETLFKNKVISRQTWAQEEGYDDKKEFANIKDDEKNFPPEKEPGSKVGESVEESEHWVFEARKGKPKQGPQHAAHNETIDGKKFKGGQFVPKDDESSATPLQPRKGKDATPTSANKKTKAGDASKKTQVRGKSAKVGKKATRKDKAAGTGKKPEQKKNKEKRGKGKGAQKKNTIRADAAKKGTKAKGKGKKQTAKTASTPKGGDGAKTKASAGPKASSPVGTDADSKGKYRGGRHGDTKGPKDDGLESHHMPADSVNGLPRDKGSAIQMDPEDHAKTASHGSQGLAGAKYRAEQKALIDKGRFGEAIQKDIDDVRGKFGNKYDQAIKEMVKSLDSTMKKGLNDPPF